MESTEALKVAIGKIDGSIKEMEHNLALLQGMLAAYQKMRVELVAMLASEEQKKASQSKSLKTD